MITIEITEETATIQQMVYALQEIAKSLEKGFTSGIDPTFSIEGEEEPENDN